MGLKWFAAFLTITGFAASHQISSIICLFLSSPAERKSHYWNDVIHRVGFFPAILTNKIVPDKYVFLQTPTHIFWFSIHIPATIARRIRDFMACPLIFQIYAIALPRSPRRVLAQNQIQNKKPSLYFLVLNIIP